jgi:ATP-dependent RNA helicase DDX46/PRP5
VRDPHSTLHSSVAGDQTLTDYKDGVSTILIATSIAARGLDVKLLNLVVNYACPNHYEDYVHRCGRTGRAGMLGTAVTFITEEEERFAPVLVKALTNSQTPVPADLQALADAFNKKRAEGKVKHGAGSGFGGKSFGFSGEEREGVKASKMQKRAESGFVDEDDGGAEEDEDFRMGGGDDEDTGDNAGDIVAIKGWKRGATSTTAATAAAAAAAAVAAAAPAAGSAEAIFQSVVEKARDAAAAALGPPPAAGAPPPNKAMVAVKMKAAAAQAAMAAAGAGRRQNGELPFVCVFFVCFESTHPSYVS